MRRVLLAAAALLATAASVAAVDQIRLADGTVLRGQATQYDSAREVLFFTTEAGEALELGLDRLDVRAVWRVARSQVARDDGEAQLQLANYTRDIELFAHAVRHYDYALKADPGLKERVEAEMAVLRRRAGDWAMGRARAAIDEGNAREAEKWLTEIVQKLPDEPIAEEARKMLDAYYDEVRAERTAAVEAAHADLFEKDLAAAKRHYDSMVARNRAALQNTRSSSRAVREWESAVRDGERALRELDRWEERNSDRPEATAGYRRTVDDQIVEVHLNLASHYSTQSSYKRAQQHVNRALAIDPKNTAALAARARIEEAASRGIRW